MKENSVTFWKTTLALTFLANLGILFWSVARWTEIGVILYRSVWGAVLLVYLATLAGCAWLFFNITQIANSRLAEKITQLDARFNQSRRLGWILFAAILFLIPYLKFTFRVGEVIKKSTQDPVLTMILFYWAVWWLILLAVGALKLALNSSWEASFATALVIMGIAYELFIRFQAVSTYPLSLGWSEASRYYYASLYFSKWIYGESIPLSTLHPTRYFLQSLAFLIPGGLVWHRLWQVLLWIGLTGAAAWAIAAKAFSAQGSPNGLRWLFAGWLFLFLLRVGVYYHLEVMVIVPVLFVSVKHPWRSLAAVVLASAWAGVSRVNWFPVPAMIAVAIYLMEVPLGDEKKNSFSLSSTLRYLSIPILWGVAGLLSALAAQAVYIPLSGNAANARAFTSSFTSDLLWYRLWPNDSYPLGIVPAILIVSGPLVAVLILSAWKNGRTLHPLRWFGLTAMLLVLFAGSLVVSTKIGGGGDLHNMDAFAVLLSVVAAWFIGDKVAGADGSAQKNAPAWPIAAIAVLIPVAFLIPSLSPYPKWNEKNNAQAQAQLIRLVDEAGKTGPVLFINERQMVTFHEVNAPLVADYEAVTLMEMAMSGNQDYLNRFYDDLRNHRFAAIVAGKQNLAIKEEGSFAEENNVWNARVAAYLLCYYESQTVIEADESKIEFFTPRNAPGVCP